MRFLSPGGADLFVCEVTDLSIYDARMAKAKEAGVKTMILSHLVPGAIGNAVAGFSDAACIEDVRKHFDGNVIAGRDQMVM